MPRKIPNGKDISIAIDELFRIVIGINIADASKALIPRMPIDVNKGTYCLPPFEDLQMNELCEFITQFNSIIQSTTDDITLTRIKALVYCHIMEAGLPLAVLWNFIRIIEDKPVEWPVSRITEKGKKEILIMPDERISEILSMSTKNGLKIGFRLNELWNKELRNSFTHANYTIYKNGHLNGYKSISPLTKDKVKQGKAEAGNLYYFSTDEIDQYYQGALTYLKIFIEKYWFLRNLMGDQDQ
jgi:hypothetical protein